MSQSSDLTCRTPVRSGHLDPRHAILRSWRVFRDELLNLYFKIMTCFILSVLGNLSYCLYWLEIKNQNKKMQTRPLRPIDISSFVTLSSNRSSRTRSSKDNLLQVNPCKTSHFRIPFLTELSYNGTISLRSFVTVRLFHPLSSSSILTTLLN
jgi:hypothetical protein